MDMDVFWKSCVRLIYGLWRGEGLKSACFYKAEAATVGLL